RRGRGSVHRLRAPQGAGGGAVPAVRAPGHRHLLPDQRCVRGVLPHRRRHRHGPSRARASHLIARSAPVTDDPVPAAGAAVISHYSGLARAALAGDTITDCDPQSFADGGFGAAAYTGTGDAPEGALRASLGCGNPLAVAGLHPGQTVLDLGSGGGLDGLLSARRVAPGATAYGLAAPLTAGTQAPTCSPSPAPTPPHPGSPTPASCTATSRTSRCLTSIWTWSSPTASSTCPSTRCASSPRRSGCCGPAAGSA